MTGSMPTRLETIFDSNGYASETINEVLVACDTAGNKLGYAFNVNYIQGYGGDITFTVGIKNDGTVNGVSILEINETAGSWYECGKSAHSSVCR